MVQDSVNRGKGRGGGGVGRTWAISHKVRVRGRGLRED